MAKKTLYPIVRDFNFTIGPHCHPMDLDLFRDPRDGRIFGPVIHLDKADIWDLLVRSECFTSKAEARKNYKGDIPEIKGYFEIGPIGKGRVMIFGWSPQTPLEEA